MSYFVSRQHYYYQDIYMVEIAYPSIDYSSPDMLIEKYSGEGESYNNPIEALEVAISIMEQWQTDEPNKEIGITYGSFDGLEGSPEDIEDLRKEVQKDYEKIHTTILVMKNFALNSMPKKHIQKLMICVVAAKKNIHVRI